MLKLIKRYVLNILIWVDVGVNVIALAGSPHETISSRAGKLADAGNPYACKFCAFLAAILGPQHCQNSEVPDFGETLSGHGTRWLMVIGTISLAIYFGVMWLFLNNYLPGILT
jgi:hypothetical protein